MARRLLILLAAHALALALPVAARAATFCVNAGPGCHATLGDALAAADADASAARDRIDLGPGEYAGPFTADADSAVEIVGAGRGETVLTAASGSAVISLQAPSSILRGVTVRLGAAAGMTGIQAETAEDVAIESAGTGAAPTGFSGRTFTGGSVDLGGATDAVGVRLEGGAAPALLENVTVEVAGGTGVQVGPDPTTPVSAALRHVTLAGAGGTGTGLDLTAAEEIASTATVSSSAILGFAVAVRATDSALAEANVVTDHSAYDPDLTASTRPQGVSVAEESPDVVSDAPGLDGDLRPRFDSPLVDAADPAGGGVTDASGLARVVDGDRLDGARSDIGALEYQRRPPQITAALAAPAGAAVGAAITFSAAAIDPDGEAVDASWAFSDGATASGWEVAHAFAAAGAASATVTVTDAAGESATATVPVTITAPPPDGGAPPPEGGAPPPDGGDPPPTPRPSVIARVLPSAVVLRADRRRDRRKPYRFRLRGRVVLPEGISTAGCQGGDVRLRIRAGTRRMTRSATVGANCRFRVTLKLGRKRARRVVVTPRFGGTGALAPLDGRKLRLRAG